MQVIKASAKPMVQGSSNGNDLKRIIFSNNGSMVISIDRTFGVKLWNALEQTLIHSFQEITFQHAVFSPDDRKIILVGRSSLYVYDSRSLEELKRLDNGLSMGTADCSLDNLHLVYTNSSQLIIRDLNTFQRLYYLPQNVQDTSEKDCLPFFVKFNPNSNQLFTSSLNSGQLCKWTLPTSEVAYIPKNDGSYNSSNNTIGNTNQNILNSSRLTVVVKQNLQSIVSEIRFSDQHLLVSSDRNQRKLFIVNTTTLKIVTTRIMPKSFFLDFNTEVQSVYSYYNDQIFSVTIPGDFLFIHNGSSLNFITSKNISINTYAISYDENEDILALGGQVANRNTSVIEDQVIFYTIARDCTQVRNTLLWQKAKNNLTKSAVQYSSQCQCIEEFGWNRKTQACQKLDCQLEQKDKNSCKCPSSDRRYRWNKTTSQCEIDCETVENSFKMRPYSKLKGGACPCKDNFRWNPNTNSCRSLNCRQIEGSTGRLNIPYSINSCECQPNFIFDSKKFLCILDCSQLSHTLPDPSFFSSISISQSLISESISRQRCKCQSGYYWHSQIYACLQTSNKDETPLPNKDQSPLPNKNQTGIPSNNPYPSPVPIPAPNPIPIPEISGAENVPIIAIILPIVIVMSLCLLAIVVYCYYKRCKIKQDTEKGMGEVQRQSQKARQNKGGGDGHKHSQRGLENIRDVAPSQKNRDQGKQDQISQCNDFQIQTSPRQPQTVQRIDIQQQNTPTPLWFKNPKSISKQSKKDKSKLGNTQKTTPRQDQHQSDHPTTRLQNSSSNKLSLTALKNHLSPKIDILRTVCQCCLQPDPDSMTSCGHYFHYCCIERQISDGAKECPACWCFLNNGMKDVHLIHNQERFVIEEEMFQSDNIAQS